MDNDAPRSRPGKAKGFRFKETRRRDDSDAGDRPRDGEGAREKDRDRDGYYRDRDRNGFRDGYRNRDGDDRPRYRERDDYQDRDRYGRRSEDDRRVRDGGARRDRYRDDSDRNDSRQRRRSWSPYSRRRSPAGTRHSYDEPSKDDDNGDGQPPTRSALPPPKATKSKATAVESTSAPKTAATPSEMIVVHVNDRLGTKAAIPCLGTDTIRDFKIMVAMRIGREPHEILLKRQSQRPFRDALTLDDYEISNGVQLDLEMNTED